MWAHRWTAFACALVLTTVLAPGALATTRDDPMEHISDSLCAVSNGLACPSVQPVAQDNPVVHIVDTVYEIILHLTIFPSVGGTSGPGLEAR